MDLKMKKFLTVTAAIAILAFASCWLSLPRVTAQTTDSTQQDPTKRADVLKRSDQLLKDQTDRGNRAELLLKDQETRSKRVEDLLVREEQLEGRQEAMALRYQKILDTWEQQQKQYQQYLDSLKK